MKFIGDRSGIFGTIITPWGKLRAKNDKNGTKIDKNCAKIALFLYIFRVCSLKILYWTENHAHDSSESVKRVIPKITSWKLRGGARAPVPHSWRRQCAWQRTHTTIKVPTHHLCNRMRYGRSRSSKVVDYRVNRSGLWDCFDAVSGCDRQTDRHTDTFAVAKTGHLSA